jgi:hypothetical protein
MVLFCSLGPQLYWGRLWCCSRKKCYPRLHFKYGTVSLEMRGPTLCGGNFWSCVGHQY